MSVATPVALSAATLTACSERVAVPSYDRSRISAGIAHFGVGSFHRAHQAMYTEAALNAGDRRWGIVGASLRSPAVRDALKPQDGLYTALSKTPPAEGGGLVSTSRSR